MYDVFAWSGVEKVNHPRPKDRVPPTSLSWRLSTQAPAAPPVPTFFTVHDTSTLSPALAVAGPVICVGVRSGGGVRVTATGPLTPVSLLV